MFLIHFTHLKGSPEWGLTGKMSSNCSTFLFLQNKEDSSTEPVFQRDSNIRAQYILHFKKHVLFIQKEHHCILIEYCKKARKDYAKE